MKNDEPLFVVKDVCEALAISNYRDAVAKLDDDERGSVLVDTLGGRQQMTAVNESGLYNLIFQSRKPQAKAFRKWVTGEVLPSIRKTGRYENKPQRQQGTRQYVKRGELTNIDILNLLWLIGEFLQQGDINAIAMDLGVSRQTVSETLNGRRRNSRVLTALYNRARENRNDGLLDVYHSPKAMRDRLLGISNGGQDKAQRLLGGQDNLDLEPVWPKNGKYGNQNARKKPLKDETA